MTASTIYLGIYGLLLFTGAYFGKKKGSSISMVMGLISGLLVLVSLYYLGSSPELARNVLIGVSILLSCVFTMRLIKTKKIMPSGLLLAASVIALIVSLTSI